MGKNKAYYATIKLDRVWFIIKDFRLAREEMKNSDSWYKVLNKKQLQPSPFFKYKIKPWQKLPYELSPSYSQGCCEYVHILENDR